MDHSTELVNPIISVHKCCYGSCNKLFERIEDILRHIAHDHYEGPNFWGDCRWTGRDREGSGKGDNFQLLDMDATHVWHHIVSSMYDPPVSSLSATSSLSAISTGSAALETSTASTTSATSATSVTSATSPVSSALLAASASGIRAQLPNPVVGLKRRRDDEDDDYGREHEDGDSDGDSDMEFSHVCKWHNCTIKCHSEEAFRQHLKKAHDVIASRSCKTRCGWIPCQKDGELDHDVRFWDTYHKDIKEDADIINRRKPKRIKTKDERLAAAVCCYCNKAFEN